MGLVSMAVERCDTSRRSGFDLSLCSEKIVYTFRLLICGDGGDDGCGGGDSGSDGGVDTIGLAKSLRPDRLHGPAACVGDIICGAKLDTSCSNKLFRLRFAGISAESSFRFGIFLMYDKQNRWIFDYCFYSNALNNTTK